MAKIRYRQVSQGCTISDQDGEIQVKFDQPQRAITPGQSVVFYAQDVCLGGAIIKTRRT
jgi:tRNA-specific 2-thiouridylase